MERRNVKNRSDGPEKSGEHQACRTIWRRDENAERTVGRRANVDLTSLSDPGVSIESRQQSLESTRANSDRT